MRFIPDTVPGFTDSLTVDVRFFANLKTCLKDSAQVT
jgi:hypothetical protein